MNGRVGLLAVLLLVQVLVIGGLWATRSASEPEAQTLLDFSPADITRVVITEGAALPEDSEEAEAADDGEQDRARVTIERRANSWMLEDLPVAQARLQELLGKLANLDSPWPVATTNQARERFKVEDEAFEKRLQLFAGDDEVATLLLGTSPGFKRIHARRSGDEAVYSIALTSLDLPMVPADWLDKGLLASNAEITAVKRAAHWEAGLQASTTPASWSLRSLIGGPAADETLAADGEAVAALVNRFKSLQVIGPNALPSAEQVDAFELRSADGQTLQYRLYRDEDEDRYGMEREGISGRYQIAGYIAEQMQLTLEDLQPAPAQGADDSAADAPAVPVAAPTAPDA